MKIILIGAGKLATQLGKNLLVAGHDILQVYSRTIESASALATLAGGAPTNDISQVRNDADLYIVSVKDDVLPGLVPQLCKGRENCVFLHTAGSMPMDVFRGMAIHYGVLYPMQTFSKEVDVRFENIPCFVEANDDYAHEMIISLASSISSRIYEMTSENRKYLHLAAVFVCNFVNHCYSIGADILQQHGIPFDVMLPLIEETARKVHEMSPIDAQTGPAVRYDENVIRNQSSLLKTNLLFKDIYERMSMSIHRRYMQEQKKREEQV